MYVFSFICIHICIYSRSYIFIYVCIHIYVYMNENSILNTQTPSVLLSRLGIPTRVVGWVSWEPAHFVFPTHPASHFAGPGRGSAGNCCRARYRAWRQKLLVGREARAAPWHLAGSPAPPLRKDLVQRRPPAKLAAFFFPADPQPRNPTLGPA